MAGVTLVIVILYDNEFLFVIVGKVIVGSLNGLQSSGRDFVEIHVHENKNYSYYCIGYIL